MEEKELFAKRRSSVRLMWSGRFKQLPFAFEPLNEETFRFYDLRNYHFEDSSEAFLEYLERRGDTGLVVQVRMFLETYDLSLYWQRFTRYRNAACKSPRKPTLEETRKVKKVITQPRC
jgi:CDP-glycerol glycerophosphotransferase (TagB/SpsB family)